MTGPTPAQLQVLVFVFATAKRRGAPPTIREIAEHIGVSSTNAVTDHLRALERKGLVSRGGSLARSISLTAAGRAAASREPHVAAAPCSVCGR